jgi:hypothetical protein
MKVSQHLEKNFNPITLTIVFETQTEYDTFRWAMSYNESLPELAYKTDSYKANVLSETMTKVHNEMKKTL